MIIVHDPINSGNLTPHVTGLSNCPVFNLTGNFANHAKRDIYIFCNLPDVIESEFFGITFSSAADAGQRLLQIFG